MLTEMTTSGRCIVTPTLASRRPAPSFRLFQIPAHDDLMPAANGGRHAMLPA